MEFVRRFALHILPKGFTRIRHFGILSSTAKADAIALIRKQFANKKIVLVTTKAEEFNPLQCQCCKKETMIRLMNFDQRGPPSKVRYTKLLQSLKTN